MTLGERIDAPKAQAPRVGLLQSVPVITHPSEAGWGQGIHYLSETCAGSAVLDVCESGAKPAGQQGLMLNNRPFVVMANYSCSTFGFEVADYAGKAQRRLAASQGYAIEQELWSGNLATAQSYPNRFLNDGNADDVGGTGDPLAALAMLEYELGEYIDGAPGMIHAPRNIVTLWAEKGGLLRREGNVIRTINDTIVVPGAGYPQSGGVVFATDLIEVHVGPVRTIPSGDDFARVDTALNTIEVRAERVAAIAWPHCVQLKASVTAPIAFN